MPEVVAVIVTYNAMPWLDKCFSSLASSEFPIRVVVVDNDSSDRTVQIIRDHFPSVEIIQSPRNLGFGQANNLGIDRALSGGADYLLLLNQDAWIEPSTVAQLIAGINLLPDTLILSPVHLDGKGMDLDLYFRRYLKEAGHFLEDNFSAGSSAVPRYLDVPFVNAAAWFLPAETIRRIGGFDPVFFHYGEDRHYASRVRYFGGHIRVDTGTVIYHDRAERIRSTGAEPQPTLDREWVHYLAQACDPSLQHYALFAARRGLRHFLGAGTSLLRGNVSNASLQAALGRRIWFRSAAVHAARKRNRQPVRCVPNLDKGRWEPR